MVPSLLLSLHQAALVLLARPCRRLALVIPSCYVHHVSRELLMSVMEKQQHMHRLACSHTKNATLLAGTPGRG